MQSNSLIYFEDLILDWQDLDQLTKVYPEFVPISAFVKSWINGSDNFHFQTSGSTGKPKQIEISRSQIASSVLATQKYLNLSSEDMSLLVLKPQYIASIMMAARALVLNMDLVVGQATNNPANLLNQKQISFASFVPMQIYGMIASGDIGVLANVRNVLIGGAPLSPKAFEVLSNIPSNIYLTYGMTETVSHIALRKIDRNYKSNSFQVVENIEIGTTKDHCLTIKGPVTNNQTLYTHDIVELINSKQFKWIGRSDHVINTGGIKVAPEMLENTISDQMSDINKLNQYFVGGLEDEKLGQKLILFIEGQSTFGSSLKAITPKIVSAFDKYHVPKEVIRIERFDRTESGKIKRASTIEKYLRSVSTVENN